MSTASSFRVDRPGKPTGAYYALLKRGGKQYRPMPPPRGAIGQHGGGGGWEGQLITIKGPEELLRSAGSNRDNQRRGPGDNRPTRERYARVGGGLQRAGPGDGEVDAVGGDRQHRRAGGGVGLQGIGVAAVVEEDASAIGH